jgi:hypothetical protein
MPALSSFLGFITLGGLEYLQYCVNFFELLLVIELILFSIIGFLFTEKIITISTIQAAIYFFLINVIIALIFLYNCILFLNIIILINTPINLNYLMFIDILGYYFLIQFNFYSVISLLIFISLFLVGVLLFKLTIMPFASWIVIVYSELS